jgi:hypothetical protein
MKIILQALLLASLTAPATAQDVTCGICADLSVPLEPNKSFGDSTCGEINTAIQDLSDAECANFFADGIPFGAFCGCANEDVACGLCADLSEPEEPDKLFGDDTTCGQLNMALNLTPEGQCGAFFDEIGGFGVGAFCGCANEDIACGVCANKEEPGEPDKLIGDDFDDFTCGQLNFAAALTPEGQCDAFFDEIGGFSFGAYCGCEGEAIVNPTCGVCKDGGNPGTPDKALMLVPFTCEQANELVASVPEVECDATVADIGLAVGVYCGCEGENIIPDECALCPEGEEVARPNGLIPDSDGLTCAEGEQFVRFITDQTICEGPMVGSARTACGCVSTKGGKKGGKKGSKKTSGKKSGKKNGKKSGKKSGKKE